MDEVRQSSTGMGEDDFAALVLLQRIADKQTHSGTASLMGVVEHGLREGRVDEMGIDRMSGVDEDDGLSFA